MENEVVEHAVKQARDAGYRDDSTADMIKLGIEKGENRFETFPNPVKYGEALASSKLIYNRSETTGKYYHNAIDMTVKEGDNQVKQYVFKIDQYNKWTQKMAFNALDGRAVFRTVKPKDKEQYGAWFQFDRDKLKKGVYELNQYHPNFGFVLEDVVKKYNLVDKDGKPLNEKGLEELMQSLKRGNQQEVRFMLDGKIVPGYMEAAPAWSSVNTYDGQKVMFPKEHELSGHYKGNKNDVGPKEAPTSKEAVAQENKQTVDSPAQKNDKGSKQSTEEGNRPVKTSRRKVRKV